MNHNRRATAVAVVLVALIVAGATVIVRDTFLSPKAIDAFFPTATAVYPGDEVRVSGVKVGTIASITPEGTQTRLTLHVDPDVAIPADAKAVIVAQNLVAARYVQLTPAYRSGTGPTMSDGAIIPLDRTAVPVDWDEVKTQLTRLATDLGPTGDVSTSSVGRFIDSAANAMNGNGDKLRQTVAQLAGVGRILAGGSGNIVKIIENLQTFVTALRDSSTQVVSFQDRFASLTSVLDESRSELDGALTHLSEAVGEVQRFVANSRNQTSEQLQRLANVTQNLVDHRVDLENVLHVAPNAYANAYNIYNPDIGGPVGSFVFNNFSSPTAFLCGAIGALENATAPETSKLCSQYLGPALRLINFNSLPIPTNLYLAKSADPAHLVYTEPGLAPGGAGAKPMSPEPPPAVSAYTGLLDNPYPVPAPGAPPFPPGPSAPDHLPAPPSPALFPRAPVPPGVLAPQSPGPASLPEMLLPAEAPPGVDKQVGPPQGTDGAPPS